MRKRKPMTQLRALVTIAGDIGELRAERGDPELTETLALIKTLINRVTDEVLEGAELPLRFED